MIMPWGKYKGQEVKSLPVSYLDWCLRHLSIKWELKLEICQILNLDPEDFNPTNPIKKFLEEKKADRIFIKPKKVRATEPMDVWFNGDKIK